MKRRLRLKLTKLFVIVICWLMVAILITSYDYFALQTDISAGLSSGFSFTAHLLFNLFTALAGALMGGSFLVFFVADKYRDKPYGFTIAAVVFSFIVVVSVITVLLGLVFVPLQTGHSLSEPETKRKFLAFLTNPVHVKNIIVWSVVVALTQVMLQFNTKFGEGNLFNMIRGKYQTPREEQRIFMFVDLNSSTTIAEKLGDEKYHELLKEFFADITNPIIDNKGEIYQYVGDEVVVAWKYEDGIQDTNCIDCFFDMKKEVQKQEKKYMSRYGLLPGFKAGLHCGRVVAGEVGIIKRDITFSGDVLNTTSRIQGKCKEFSVEIIASDDLLTSLKLDGKFTTHFLGSIKLRGKEKDMELSTIVPAAV